MKTKRETAIQRARATAYVKQQRLRDDIASKVERALQVDPRQAYMAWEAKTAEADAFVQWLRQQVGKQALPPSCALLVSWLLRSPGVAFSAYNPYMQRLAREAAAAASGLDAGAVEVADGMVRMLNDAVSSKE